MGLRVDCHIQWSKIRNRRNGGGPQGTVLGMFLFLILINKAGFEEQNLKLDEILTTAAGRRDEISKTDAKYDELLSSSRYTVVNHMSM